MIVWRLTRRLHLEVALRGVGAARFGGRWNSPDAVAKPAAFKNSQESLMRIWTTHKKYNTGYTT